ncbi:MAG: TonB-dependent receptor, partial [Bacteroidota bacterium]|nr:TonB-dependent receptor [Bacteroidota bacterium]
KKQHKIKFTSDITCSIYNAYNRMNPFFLYIDTHGDVGGGGNSASGNTKGVSFTAKQVSLFPLLPSVTWNFKFL